MAFWALLASITAVGCETYFKLNPGKMYWELPWALPLGILVNVGIWGLLRTETIFGMAVIFGFLTVMLRIGATYYLGEKPTLGTWIAFGLLVLAMIVKLFVK